MGEGPQVNEGIVLSGNARVSGSALAAGRNASATAHHTAGATGAEAADAVRAALDAVGELRRLLADAELPPGQRRQARDETDAIRDELSSDDVDPGRIVGRLERLRTLLGSATGLLGLVAEAQESVRAIAGG
ncbi:hypothetical protein [Streptomyces corynorhini]|uniref:DUF4404 family protein n=1 Tax=Streptomyces corynorhini TaxID=2282652 RepID=A0A370BAV7_9ACTN|nr:hypothetical protein [Streptomyces corynorhini]RDG38947.1 hypothetical protein DVH02_06240 [Streptomyces corynorhini]